MCREWVFALHVNACISMNSFCDFRVFGNETIVVSHGSKLVMD